MTTSPVMTVTDELLAELEDAAGNATQDAWELLPGTSLSGPEVIANGEPIAWVLNSEADAVHIALANPATIAALTAELRRLRAENAELAKDAGRYRWLRDSIWYVGPDDFYCGEGGDMNEYQNHNFNAEALDTAIDAAMQADQ